MVAARLKEVDPAAVGIVVSKRKLVVVQGGTCDFYTIALATPPASSVVVSIRASLGAVNVQPDTIHFRPDEYSARTIVVLSDTGSTDAQEFGLVHYVSSQMPQLDGLMFKLKVFVVEREGPTLLSFGKNDCGQLGHACTRSRDRTGLSSAGPLFDQMPRFVAGLPPNAIFRHMAGGVEHCVVLLSDGTVYSWGSNNPPIRIRKLDEKFVHQVACGSYHTLILANCGTAFFFGDLFADGAGGIRTAENVVLEPRRISELGPEANLKVTKVACGANYNACVVQDSVDGLFTWGRGIGGVLGHGDCADQTVPKRVEKLPPVTILDMAAGRYHLTLLTMTGEVVVQGHGDEGRLGLGDENSQLFPVMVPNLPLCRLVAAGAQHTAILDEDLNVWTWGSNQCGQLGLTNRITEFKMALNPHKLGFFEGKGCCSVHLGDFHSLALTLYGLVYTWGSHDSGQLGRRYGALSGVMNGHEGSSMPVVVEDLMHRPAVQVAGTASGSMAVTVFEYPSSTTEKFQHWKQIVKDADERRRQQSCKEFRQMLHKVQKRNMGKKSSQWEIDHQKAEERKGAIRSKQEERRQKALHRQDQVQTNVVSQNPNSIDLQSASFVEHFSIANDMKHVIKPPISVTLDEYVSDFRKKKEEKQNHAAKRTRLKNAAAEERDVGHAMTFTYFDPPSCKSFSGMLADLLSPSDALKESAAALYMVNPDRYLRKPGLIAAKCPGILKLNSCLGIPPTSEELGYDIRSEPLDLSVEDNGDILEMPGSFAGGEEKVITVFGDFFDDDDEEFYCPQMRGGMCMRVCA